MQRQVSALPHGSCVSVFRCISFSLQKKPHDQKIMQLLFYLKLMIRISQRENCRISERSFLDLLSYQPAFFQAERTASAKHDQLKFKTIFSS
ncbi:hypothetical protein HMPREF1141_1745 [Clostridium sp. MSTE9]|nr:hypothetical protein HMPREF1141_1745 [Clostridium sp. MSTE9]